MNFLQIAAVLVPLFFSCASRDNYRAEKFFTNFYDGSIFKKYYFQNAKELNKTGRSKLGLAAAEDVRYILLANYQRDFIAANPGRESLYIVGEQHLTENPQAEDQAEFYNLLLLVDLAPELILARSSSKNNLNNLLRFPMPWQETHQIKDFMLAVQDFNGDGLDDLFWGFARGRGQFYYYLHIFSGEKLEAIVRPWSSFSQRERQDGLDKYYSPFMRELNADIYAAFVAEIELAFNYKFTIDLSPLADDLIRDKIYDSRGLVLQKRGVPHLDFNPILLPVRHKSGKYLLRSVQQVSNRYGQIGIFICDWAFSLENGAAAAETTGRWLPDEASMEFLSKPRI